MSVVSVPSSPPVTTATAAISELEMLRRKLELAEAAAEAAEAAAEAAEAAAERANAEAAKARAEKAATNECAICMDASCDVALVPCGHVCCCEGCARQLKECPSCRVDVEGTSRVYLACLIP